MSYTVRDSMRHCYWCIHQTYVRLLLWTRPDSSQGKGSLLGPFWPPLLPHTSVRVHAPCHGLCFYTFIICLDTQKPTSTATEGLNGGSGGAFASPAAPMFKRAPLGCLQMTKRDDKDTILRDRNVFVTLIFRFYCFLKYCISLPLWPQPNSNTDKENTPVFCSFWASQKLNQVIFWIIY